MKNRFSLMSLASIAAIIFIFNIGFTKSISAQTCQNPPLLPIQVSFPQNSVVNFYIEPTFTHSQQETIRFQLALWSNKGLANVSFNEVFDVGDLGDPFLPGAAPAMIFARGIPPKLGAGAQGENTLQSSTGCLNKSTVTINLGVTDPTAFSHVVSHEIGHAFALDECENCPPRTSAMTVPQTPDLNEAGGHSGPTTCDVGQMRACIRTVVCNYQEPEQPSDPSGYGELSCEICFDGSNNDCETGTDLEDYKCSDCISPIVIDTLGDGFDLTSAEDGVEFDIAGVGRSIRVSWTQGDEAWLALDRNGNGIIDSGKELFGAATSQPASTERNGFLALAEYDKPTKGGNGDGVIDSSDEVFNRLRLWQDVNHNGVSEANELHALPFLNVVTMELDYKKSKQTDEFGNQFRYRAKVKDAKGSKLGRWAWDVFLNRTR